MATQSFFIISGKDKTAPEGANGTISSKDKTLLGVYHKNEAPSGRTFLTGKLDGHWVITDEEYKLLKTLKK